MSLSVAELCNRDLTLFYEVYSPEEQKKLAFAYRENGDAALRDELVGSVVKWVFKLARTYVRRYQCGHLYWDVVQEGFVGVLTGVEKYEPNRGYTLTTYVTWWIKQNIARFLIEEINTIRIPVHRVEKIKKLQGAQAVLFAELGRRPSDEELVERGWLTEEEVRTVRSSLFVDGKQIRPLGEVIFGENEEDGITLEDALFKEQDIQAVFELAESRNIQQRICEFLFQTYGHRKALCVIWYFGLDGREPMMLEDIGRELPGGGVSKQRVGQHKEKLLSCPHFRQFLQALINGEGAPLVSESS